MSEIYAVFVPGDSTPAEITKLYGDDVYAALRDRLGGADRSLRRYSGRGGTDRSGHGAASAF